ncbi:class A sortase [Paenibacillus larvae]
MMFKKGRPLTPFYKGRGDNKFNKKIGDNMSRVKKYKQRCRDTLFVIFIFLLLTTGVVLIFSPWLQEAVIKTIISPYRIAHFSVEEIQNNRMNGKFENDLSHIETPSLATVLTNMNKVNKADVVGEIAIGDVGIILPILKGTNTQNLLVGATTLKEGQIMGEGNYVLAGHHMRDETLLFGPLQQVQKGTFIQLTNKQNLYTYEVVEKKIVHESETDILQETSSPKLTLITCDVGGRKTNKRLVVIAQLVNTGLMDGDSKYVKQYNQQVNSMEKEKDDLQFWVGIIVLCCICLIMIAILLLYYKNKTKKNL